MIRLVRPIRKTFPWAVRIVAVGLTLGVLGVCGWFVVIRPLGQTLCIIRPDSLRNPAAPPNAEQIEYGNSSFQPQKGFDGKLVQFQSADSPAKVYEFYKEYLGQDRWLEDHAQHVTAGPSRLDTKFNWECASIDSMEIYSTIWFHAEAVGSGKTVVTLNYEYLP